MAAFMDDEESIEVTDVDQRENNQYILKPLSSGLNDKSFTAKERHPSQGLIKKRTTSKTKNQQHKPKLLIPAEYERAVIHKEDSKLSELCGEYHSQIQHSEILSIHPAIFEKLFDHQIVGVNFLYENFKSKNGCVLADDMGLGKTVQISTFLGALKIAGYIKHAMVVVPATLLDYWEAEIMRWVPRAKCQKVFKIYGSA